MKHAIIPYERQNLTPVDRSDPVGARTAIEIRFPATFSEKAWKVINYLEETIHLFVYKGRFVATDEGLDLVEQGDGTRNNPLGSPRWAGTSLEDLESWLERVADEYDKDDNIPGWKRHSPESFAVSNPPIPHMKYKVIVKETLAEETEIEANSPEEAEVIAWDNIEKGYYEINMIDSHNVEVVGPIDSPDNYAEQQMKLLETIAIHKEGDWFKGTIAGYEFFAKVYKTGSKYGIGEGRISKLTVRQAPAQLTQPPHCIINYDRGWDIEPETDYHRMILDTLVEYFENLPADAI